MSSSESSRRFHFIREIASGGFGSVYLTKVIHADGFSRLVAVKLLHPRWSENEEIASRMRDEARLLGWLRHKNIVDVMDLTLIDGRCAVIMEYLDAVDTKVVINHCAETGTRVPLRPALEICAAVASALDAAYNRPPYAGEKPLRVIHRDIKPSNIMLDGSGIVKVLDFGVARAEFNERESKTQEIAFGSLEYMPPERLFFEPESPASDVYSLGATLFEMLALEKFGKAKLRPKEHEAYFEDRFDLLLDRYPMHREAEDLLHELLMSMLAFDEPDRPTAADAVAKMRAFARRLTEHPLEEWAEGLVPDLLEATRQRSEEKSPGSLVDTILTEDAKALDQRSIWDENTGASTRAIDLTALDDELTGSLADDARWRALKQATIEDMAKRGELPRNIDPEPVAMVEPEPEPPAPPTEPEPQPAAPPRPRRVATEPPPKPLEPIAVPGAAARPPPPPSADPDEDETVVAANMPPPDLPPTIDPEPEPVARGRGLMATVVVMFLVGSGVALIALAVLVLVVAIGMMGATTTIEAPPTPPPAIAPMEQPVEPVEPVAPPEPAGPHARFTSAQATTKTMSVSCEVGDRVKGVDTVSVDGEAPGKCLVVAILGDGSRLRATVDDTEPIEYLCFVGDERECRAN